MKFIRGLENLTVPQQFCAVTIGNFDGVHLGHQSVIEQLKINAKQLNLSTLAVIFEPQPNEFFNKNNLPPRLMRLREKIVALEQQGVDRILCLPFNQTLAQLDAELFIKKILVDSLSAKYVVIGDDFRFGKQRQGDLDLLKKMGLQFDFAVDAMPTFIWHGERVSSTRIRQLLQAGNLDLAAELLGHSFKMSGRVAHGDKRGRIIGFPTANIFLHRKAVPVSGVFAVKAYGIDPEPILGVANVGNRPTFNGTRSLLETHLFDFNREIYGEHIEIEFCYKLRDEQRYDSFELLKQQIFLDAENAREYFAKLKS